MKTKPLFTLSLAALALSMAIPAWSGPHGSEFPISIADLEAKAAQAFAQADSNNDGEVSQEEFADVDTDHRGMRERHFSGHHGSRVHGEHMGRMGRGDHGDHSMESQAEFFAALDTDGNGELSSEEFGPENHRAARKTLMRNKMFARMDADGNGGLSQDEFPGRVQRLRTLDSNEDGEITRDELRDGRRAMREGSG